jgi:hypothetical protein
MATLADVRYWWVSKGVGHVVMSERLGWVFTPCGTMATGDHQFAAPCRKCRKCMIRLAEARVAEFTSGQKT